MFCHECGTQNPDGSQFCNKCGTKLVVDVAPIQNVQVVPVRPSPIVEPRTVVVLDRYGNVEDVSDRSRLAAFLFAFFLGGLGIHNFYLGHIGKGVVQLLLPIVFLILGFFTLGIAWLLIFGWAIWVFVEWILIVCGVARDAEGRLVTRW